MHKNILGETSFIHKINFALAKALNPLSSFIGILSETFFSSIKNRIVASLLFLNLYFLAHLFIGQNSIFDYKHLKKNITFKEKLLVKIQSENQECKNNIKMLNSENPNLDYIEEMAKQHLHYSYQDEIVIKY